MISDPAQSDPGWKHLHSETEDPLMYAVTCYEALNANKPDNRRLAQIVE